MKYKNQTSSEAATSESNHICIPFPCFTKPRCNCKKENDNFLRGPGWFLLVGVFINNSWEPKLSDIWVIDLVFRAFVFQIVKYNSFIVPFKVYLNLNVCWVGNLFNTDHLHNFYWDINRDAFWWYCLLVTWRQVQHSTFHFVAEVSTVQVLVAPFVHGDTKSIMTRELVLLAGSKFQLGSIWLSIVTLLVSSYSPSV